MIPDIPALSLIGAIGDSLPVVTFGDDPEARADLDFASTTLIGDGFIGSSFQGLAPDSGWLYLEYRLTNLPPRMNTIRPHEER